MPTKANFNKSKAAPPTGKANWRIDFRRRAKTTEVAQWARERGESRVQQGTPPLFIAREADKDEALAEFAGLDPEVTMIAAEAEQS